MRIFKKLAFLVLVTLRVSFCGKTIVHYKTDDALSWLNTDKIALLTENGLMLNNLRPHAIKDISRFGGEYISVSYSGDKPVLIEAKDTRKAVATFSINENQFTAAKIEYDGGKASLRMYYFDQEVPFRAGNYYYSSKIEFEQQSDSQAIARLFLPSGYEIALIKILRVQGTVYEQGFWSPTGVKLKSMENIHKIVRKFNRNGTIAEQAYFNTEGKLVSGNDGYSIIRWKYDDKENGIEKAYFDNNNQAANIEGGYSIVRQKHDDLRNVIEQSIYDAENRPTNDKHGGGISRRKFDERGNIVEKAYFDNEGQPAIYENNTAIWRFKYDGKLELLEVAHFDTQDKPAKTKDGYSSICWKRDKGNIIEEAYLDTQSRYTNHREGYSIVRMKYDNNGNQIEKAYFDIEGKPTSNQQGYSISRWKYDEKGNNVEFEKFDVHDQLTSGKFSDAGERYVYDGYRNKIESWYINVERNILISDEGKFRNVAKRKFVRDYFGRVKETLYLDESGGVIGKVKGEK